MSVFLIIIGICALVLGLIGSVAPILPGPVLSFVWLLIVELSQPVDFSTSFLLIMLALTILAALTDYLLPIRNTKRTGGSKRGTRWSTVWMIAGFFILPPWWLIIMPLWWAFVGERLLHKDNKKAWKAAYASFLWSLGSTVVKLIVASIMLRYTIMALI